MPSGHHHGITAALPGGASLLPFHAARTVENAEVDVLLVSDRQTGGVPVIFLSLARGLARLGCRVRLLADPLDGLELVEGAQAAGVELVRWRGQRHDGRALWRAVGERRWDAVLSCHRGCDLATGLACWRWGRPHVIAVHGDPSYEAGGVRLAWLRNRLWHWVVGRSRVVVAISRFVEARLIEQIPRLPPVTVVVNANVRVPRAAAARSHPSAEEPLLVACGRVYDAKRPEQLLDLVQALDARGVRCRAAWIGDGPLLEEMRAQVQVRALEGRVEFLGHREDPTTDLLRGHVFVHFCTIEGFGLAVTEGMACGLPVAAYAAGALPELITDGTEGILAPAGDLKALAAGIAALLADPRRYAACAEGSLLRSHDFSESTMAQGYLAVCSGHSR